MGACRPNPGLNRAHPLCGGLRLCRQTSFSPQVEQTCVRWEGFTCGRSSPLSCAESVSARLGSGSLARLKSERMTFQSPRRHASPDLLGKETWPGLRVKAFTYTQVQHEQDTTSPHILLTHRDGWPNTFIAILKASGTRSLAFLSMTSSSVQG